MAEGRLKKKSKVDGRHKKRGKKKNVLESGVIEHHMMDTSGLIAKAVWEENGIKGKGQGQRRFTEGLREVISGKG